MRISLIVFLLLSCSFFSAVSVYGNENIKTEDTNEIFSENAKKTGIIFNVNNILLDLESYQGGVGFKRFFNDSVAYRAAFNFSYSDSSSSWLVSIGNTIEYHFITGRVSPYVGGFFNVGYASYKEEFDTDYWMKVTSIPISFGPLLGVEVAVFPFLSLFAEYSVTFDYTTTTTLINDTGSETKEKESNFSASTSMGNDSKIGIVIYVNRINRNK